MRWFDLNLHFWLTIWTDFLNKVCKGKYPEIPKCFSFELRRVLSLMLQIKPSRRPTAEELLNLKEVKTQIEVLYFDETKSTIEQTGPNPLLETIKIPKEFVELATQLPKPHYSYDNSEFLSKYLETEIHNELTEESEPNLKSRKNSRNK